MGQLCVYDLRVGGWVGGWGYLVFSPFTNHAFRPSIHRTTRRPRHKMRSSGVRLAGIPAIAYTSVADV
jgi:hypothetical protein